MTFEDYRSKMLETVPRYQEMAGLLRKNYVYDKEKHLGGAVYLFDSIAHAKACFSAEFIARVTGRHGAPEIRYLDTIIQIDNEAKAVRDFAEECRLSKRPEASDLAPGDPAAGDEHEQLETVRHDHQG
jgi:hypothetical protein